MRLVVGGDSYTYGHGLKDCINYADNGYGPEPSKYAWPSLLGTKLNLPVKNLAMPGRGNDFIIKQFLSNDLYKTDNIVILWSFYTREMFFEESIIEPYGEWDKDFMRNKFTYSNVTDSFLKSLMNIRTFTGYLVSKSINFYYIFLEPVEYVKVYPIYEEFKSKLIKEITPYNISKKTLGVINKAELTQVYPKAEDDMHPGEEWHVDLSDLIFNHIYKDIIKLI